MIVLELFLLLLFDFCHFNPTYASKSKCDLKNSPKYIETNRFGKSCYFVVKGAKEEAYPKFFDIKKARDICSKEGATLPILRTQDEEEFLHRNYRKIEGERLHIALGLAKRNAKYIWDDNTELTHKNFLWGKSEKDDYEYTVYVPNEKAWQDFPTSADTRKKVSVVCKESTAMKKPVACDAKDNDKYIAPKTFNNRCYFVVKDAMNEANTKLANGIYKFNISVAREICDAEEATLPIIKSESEDKFLGTNFATINGHQNLFIALGLKQHKTPNGHEYKWDDETDLLYKPSIWSMKDKENALHVLHNQGVSWLTLTHPEAKLPVAVVCQQVYVVKATSPPTLDPSTGCYNRAGVIKHLAFDNTCYFTLERVTANRNVKNDLGKYAFHVKKARQDCMGHDASLPIVKRKAEADFILDNFQKSDYDSQRELGEGVQLVGVALGMKPVFKDHQQVYADFVWDDGSSVSDDLESVMFDKSNIKLGYDEEFAFTFMNSTNKASSKQGLVLWNTVDELFHDRPFAVLCQKFSSPPAQTPPRSNIDPIGPGGSGGRPEVTWGAILAISPFLLIKILL